MEICSKCQICSYITLLNSALRPQKIAVILKIWLTVNSAQRRFGPVNSALLGEIGPVNSALLGELGLVNPDRLAHSDR